jgi:ABC-type nitrate/sulfonate/bicarbonate transport system ATPase subunit
MAGVSIRDVSRVFPAARRQPETVALSSTSLEVADNDFVTILGPSGCGKSTLLRIVAGLDTATTGSVAVDGVPVRGPGADRGMVFQSYTLFPWLTIEQNIRFGLREKGMPEAQQKERAAYCGRRESPKRSGTK